MPVFNLQLEFDDSGAVVAVKRLGEVAGAANKVGNAGKQAGANLLSSLKKPLGIVASLVAAFKSLEKAMSFASRGLEINSSLEQSRIGIATLITSMAKLEDSQGNILEGAQKYAAAQGLASEMMAEIQRLGLETTATTQDLVEGVQSIMGPALQAGMALKDIPKFAVAGAQAMQTLGVPLNQMRTELEALLSGNINKSQDVLAPKLFADVQGDLGEYIKGLKESGKLLDEIKRRLEPFNQAGSDVAKTWQGLVSNMEEAIDTLAGKVSIGLMEDLKKAASTITEMFVKEGKNGQTGIADDFKNTAANMEEIADRVGAAIVAVADEIASLSKAFNDLLGTDATRNIDNLINAFKALSAALGMATIFRTIKAMTSYKQSLIAAKDATLVNALAEKKAYIEYLKTDAAKQKLRTSTEAVIQSRLKLRALTQQVTASEQALSAAMTRSSITTAAGAGLSRMAKGLSGIVAMMGGPVGAALAVAAAGATYLMNAEDDATRSTNLLTEAQQSYEAAVKGATDATGKLTRALTAAEQKQMEAAQNKALESWRLQLEGLMKEVGNLENADFAIMASGYSNAVPEELRSYINEFNTLITKLKEEGPAGTQVFLTALAGLLDKIRESKYANSDFANVLEEFFKTAQNGSASLQDAADKVQKFNESLKADKVIQSYSELDKALADITDALDAYNKAQEKDVSTAKKAVEWLEKRYIATEDGKKSQEEMAKATDQNALATLRLAVAQAQAAAIGAAFNLAVYQSTDAQLKDADDKMKMLQDLETMLAKFEKSAPNFGEKPARGRGGKGGSRSTGGAGDTSKIESAKKKWEEFSQQIAILEGRASEAGVRLEKTSKEIAETGKQAGKSAAEIEKMQAAFQKATDAKTVKELNKELAQLEGDTAALAALEKGEKLDGLREKLSTIRSMSEDEKKIYLNRIENAVARDARVKDLEASVSFLKDLQSLGGEYGSSIEYQNQLLAIHAEVYRANLAPELRGYVSEWERLKKLENDTSFMGGLERGVRKFGAEYGNLAAQVESFTMQMGSTIGNTLSEAFMKGKFSAQDFFNSLIGMAAQAASNAFIGMIFKGIGGFFGGSSGTPTSGFSGTSNNYIEGGFVGPAIPNGVYAKGGAFLGGSLSAYSGSIVSTPTFFSYDSHYDRFAKGAGLMGEAGPEAILPLKRTRSGDLGVRMEYDGAGYSERTWAMFTELRSEMMRNAVAQSTPNISINVINQTGQNVQAQGSARPDGNGGFSLDVLVSMAEQKMVGRAKQGKSSLMQYQEKAYGLNRAGILARGKGRA